MSIFVEKVLEKMSLIFNLCSFANSIVFLQVSLSKPHKILFHTQIVGFSKLFYVLDKWIPFL